MELLADGHVVAHSAAGPHGQGHATTFAQIVADALGVEPDRVELRFDELEGAGTYGGRTTAMGGSALLLAARELRARLDAGERPPLRGARPLRVRLRVRLRRVRRGRRDRPRDRRAARQADRRRRRRRHDRQPRAGRGPGARRQRARPRRQPARGVRPRRGRPAAQRQLRRLRDAVRGRGPGDPHRVRRVALAAQPARRQGHRRGRRDRRPGRARQRGRRRTRGDPRGSPYTPEKLWRATSSR